MIVHSSSFHLLILVMSVGSIRPYDDVRAHVRSTIDWAAYGGILLSPWDDGHVPERFCRRGGDADDDDADDDNTCLVRYPEFHGTEQQPRSGHVMIVDEALDPHLVQAIYDRTTVNVVQVSDQSDKLPTASVASASAAPAWGCYISMAQVREHEAVVQPSDRSSFAHLSKDELALHVVSHFLKYVTRHTTSTSASTTTTSTNGGDGGGGDAVVVDLDGANGNVSTDQQQRGERKNVLSSPQVTRYLSRTAVQPPASSSSPSSPLLSSTSKDQLHGVAVWILASDIGSQVPYHLDYAEQVRYQSNVIVPPVVAGTLHCTPPSVLVSSSSSPTDKDNPTTTTTTMTGGDFCIHLQGLEHYYRHGYKEMKQPLGANALAEDPDWITIPYRFNRMICASGHLPHMSTRIEDIAVPASTTATNQNQTKKGSEMSTTTASPPPRPPIKRVIIGLNAFFPDVGPLVQQAPEHSEAFRQMVRESRKLQKQQPCRNLSSHGNKDTTAVWTLQAVQSNPRLARSLVLAKRRQRQQEFVAAQQALDDKIHQHLHGQGGSGGGVTLADLMNRFGTMAQGDENNDDDNNNNHTNRGIAAAMSWPNLDDVRIHVLRRCRQGQWIIKTINNNNNNNSSSNMNHDDGSDQRDSDSATTLVEDDSLFVTLAPSCSPLEKTVQ